MSIDLEKLLSLRIPERIRTYSSTEKILSALGIGLGSEPTNEAQLRYVYERDLLALPTMGPVLATPGLWVRDLDTGIDGARLSFLCRRP